MSEEYLWRTKYENAELDKADRIAELEAQVAELQRQKETHGENVERLTMENRELNKILSDPDCLFAVLTTLRLNTSRGAGDAA